MLIVISAAGILVSLLWSIGVMRGVNHYTAKTFAYSAVVAFIASSGTLWVVTSLEAQAGSTELFMLRLWNSTLALAFITSYMLALHAYNNRERVEA